MFLNWAKFGGGGQFAPPPLLIFRPERSGMALEWLKWRKTSYSDELNRLKYSFGGFGTIFGGLKLSTSKTTMVPHYGRQDRMFQTSKNRPKPPKPYLKSFYSFVA